MKMGHLAKKWEKIYILGTSAEADKGIISNWNLGGVKLIQNGLGKHWVQFNLANDLFIAIQLLDYRKVVPEKIDSNRTTV